MTIKIYVLSVLFIRTLSEAFFGQSPHTLRMSSFFALEVLDLYIKQNIKIIFFMC